MNPRVSRRLLLLIACTVALRAAPTARAALPAADLEFFEAKIRPVLA